MEIFEMKYKFINLIVDVLLRLYFPWKTLNEKVVKLFFNLPSFNDGCKDG